MGPVVTSGALAAAEGWSLVDYKMQICAGTVHLAARITRTGTAITATSNGDSTNTTMAIVAPAYRSNIGYYAKAGAVLSNATNDQTWNVVLGVSGEIQVVSATIPSSTISTNDEMRMLYSWPQF